VRGGVKRPTVHAPAVAADQSLRAREHFLRGASRKRQQKYSLGRDAAVDEVRYTVHQRACLSGSRAGDDEQWTIGVSCGSCLLWIQLRGEVARGASGLGSFARGIDLDGLRHATASMSAV
jgi:hypothetical protein